MKHRLWIFKFVLAGILLGLGLFMAFADEVVYLITGVVLVLFALIRVVPLVKTLKKEVTRFIHILEVIVTAIIGGLLILASFQLRQDQNTALWILVYRYGLGAVFYVRGVIYFISTVFYQEKTKALEFVIHLIALTIGVTIFFRSDFNAGLIGLFFLIISVIGAGILTLEGYGGYKNYRLQFQEEKSPSQSKTKDRSKEVPLQKDIVIEDPKEERTYIN